MTDVIAWPPVATVSKEWTVFDPVQESINMITGATSVSAVQRRRRVATIEASARFSPYQAGAGYMEGLKRLLKGGAHLVELKHRMRTWDSRLIGNQYRGGEFIGWVMPPGEIVWEDEIGPFEWNDDSSGNLLYTITTSNGFPAVRISGLIPNVLFALPGEFATLISESTSESIMILAPATSDHDGIGILRLEAAPVGPGRIRIGADDVGVFKVDTVPRSVEPGGNDWSYTWKFTEVYEDERGPFVYRNPWSET